MPGKLEKTCLLLGFSALLAAGCSKPVDAPPPSAAAPSAPPAVQAPVSINAEMVRVVDHAAHELWNTEKENRQPNTDADWENVVEHATQIASAGALIRLEGTGPNDRTFVQQADWQKYAAELSNAGVAALKAAEAKDQPALVAANGRIVEACETCHKRFKPALPSEGIMHHHTH